MGMCNGRAALEKLLEGNKRFAVDSSQHPNQTAARRIELSNGQSPFAVVLTCSDSRVPPEIIFDQGLGDLFVVRVAGNIVDAVVLESIEYAVDHLHTPLVVVRFSRQSQLSGRVLLPTGATWWQERTFGSPWKH
jgi:carbonic anhydrase